jgi:hypothetical protein
MHLAQDGNKPRWDPGIQSPDRFLLSMAAAKHPVTAMASEIRVRSEATIRSALLPSHTSGGPFATIAR